MQLPGLYRISSGSRIIEASFDFDTQLIGPYYFPLKIHPNKSTNVSSIPIAIMYDNMIADDRILAIFNNCNECMAAMSAKQVWFIPTYVKDAFYHPELRKVYNIEGGPQQPPWQPIGFERTVINCFDAFIPPFKLIANLNTGVICGFKDKLTCTPMLNPPVTLYKELVATSHRGVYIDKETEKRIFID